MFGVKRWGGYAEQETSGAEVQARLEAWKKKARDREEVRRRESHGERPLAESKPVSSEAVGRSKVVGTVKKKSSNEAAKHSNGRFKDDNKAKAGVARNMSDGGTERRKQRREEAKGKEEHVPEILLVGATNRAAEKRPSSDSFDEKGGGTGKGFREGFATKTQEQSAKKAAELARAQKRELKRRKEVERAHKIIAKKAKKAGVEWGPVGSVPAVDASERDEEVAKEERKRLKKQKREERRKKPKLVAGVDAHEEERGAERPGVTGANEAETIAADEVPEEQVSAAASEKADGGQQTEAVDTETAAADGHRKRKGRKAVGIIHEEGERAGISKEGVEAILDVEDGDGDTEGEHRKRRKRKAASPGANTQGPDRQLSEDLERAEDGPERVENTQAGNGPVKASEPAPVKGPPLLPWMRAPIEIGEDEGLELSLVPGMEPRLRGALEKAGIAGLFPVQAAVWREMVASGCEDHDLCVCAPTGSGKTFSYALPVCQGLASRIVRRLRALVVLPTRDLASQVKAVFDLLAPALGLTVGLAVGQTSLAAEAQQLVSPARCRTWDLTPENDSTLADSNVDILVCTPGRLMDHVHDTPGFTLQHLRYLVVDETDRLLRQAYQDWLPIVLAAAAAPSTNGHVSTIRRPIPERGLRTPAPRVVKLVLSATLTRDPAKIQQLALHRPRYIATSATDHRYKVPPQLQEYRLVCTAGEKPLYLIALLHQLKGQRTIVFTASVEATHRLFTLLQAFEGLPVTAGEYSSLQPQRARSATLEAFRRGDVAMLVSSDAMTRGMDVENVDNVISYDAPVYAKTYVHRAGRTARAGRPGRCFTLLRREEVRHFKGLLRKVDNNYCPDYPLPNTATDALVPFYTAALEKLKETVVGESAGGGGSKAG